MTTKKIEQLTKNADKEIKKGETVTVRIPIDPLNPKDKDVIIGINEKYTNHCIRKNVC